MRYLLLDAKVRFDENPAGGVQAAPAKIFGGENCFVKEEKVKTKKTN